MWNRIQDANFEEFYKSTFSEQPKEFVSAMVQAVRTAQRHERKDDLYGFTSVANFMITTSPSYHEMDGHKYIQVIWSLKNQSYLIYTDYLSNGWVIEERERIEISEKDFPKRIGLLIDEL